MIPVHAEAAKSIKDAAANHEVRPQGAMGYFALESGRL